eukprot:171320-Hanusia_phi.AAC.2
MKSYHPTWSKNKQVRSVSGIPEVLHSLSVFSRYSLHFGILTGLFTVVGHQALLALSELCSKRMFAIASDRDVVVSSRRLLRPAMNKLAKDGRMLFPCGRHAASQRKRTTTVTSKSLRKERIVHLEGQSEQQQGASGEKNLDSYSFCQGGVKTQNDASVLSNLSSSLRENSYSKKDVEVPSLCFALNFHLPIQPKYSNACIFRYPNPHPAPPICPLLDLRLFFPASSSVYHFAPPPHRSLSPYPVTLCFTLDPLTSKRRALGFLRLLPPVRAWSFLLYGTGGMCRRIRRVTGLSLQANCTFVAAHIGGVSTSEPAEDGLLALHCSTLVARYSTLKSIGGSQRNTAQVDWTCPFCAASLRAACYISSSLRLRWSTLLRSLQRTQRHLQTQTWCARADCAVSLMSLQRHITKLQVGGMLESVEISYPPHGMLHASSAMAWREEGGDSKVTSPCKATSHDTCQETEDNFISKSPLRVILRDETQGSVPFGSLGCAVTVADVAAAEINDCLFQDCGNEEEGEDGKDERDNEGRD